MKYKPYIINLDRRSDRLEYFTFDYVRFPAIDGMKFTDIGLEMRGYYGAYMSFLTLLREIRDKKDEMALILEDDAGFVDGWDIQLEQCMSELPINWDLLYLGGWRRRVRPYTFHLDRALEVYCTHALMVRDKFIPKVIEKLEKKFYKADVLLSELLPDYECYICNPVLAWQRPGYSDIVYEVTNNIHLL